MPLTLTRELRFGLHEAEVAPSPRGTNGFAGNPALGDVAPFLTLTASIEGEVDPATGMLINIKQLDAVMRKHGVPFVREAYYERPRPPPGPGHVVSGLADLLRTQFLPHHLTALRLAPSPYLSFAVTDREPNMVQVALRFEFSAAHRLHAESLSSEQNIHIFGRCNNPNGHGHNYEMEVTITGPADPKTGHVMAIGELQRIVNERIVDVFDHKHLNMDCADFRELNPTVENIVQVFYRRLKPHIPSPVQLESLRLWETPKTMAEYRE
jgi:6-pyruvoyltetrahydropterin/6-carboxytetrahydropterin synthase